MFDNVAMAEGLIGSAPEQLAAANDLAAMMSRTLVRYARTGDPNDGPVDARMPRWPTYDLKNRSTMIWDHMPHVEKDPRGAERVFAEKAHYHQAGTPLP
jgi:para-nitrobenzyl esterase